MQLALLLDGCRWVDEQHAALVFENPHAASKALDAGPNSSCSAMHAYKLRPYREASAGTRALSSGDLAPAKPRPVTTAVVARRLIGNALSVKMRDKEEEAMLASARQALRQGQVQREAALESAWNDSD